MSEALQLAIKLGRLVLEALGVAVSAQNGKLTDEQVRAELERIRRSAVDDKAADWDVVRS